MRVAVVTGTSRGIGKEIVRQLATAGLLVIATARKFDDAKAVADEYGKDGNIVPFEVDVTDSSSAKKLAGFITATYGVVDVLVNNAAILSQGTATDTDAIKHILETNYFGVINVTEHLLPLLKKSSDARIINLSSGMGELNELATGFLGQSPYRLSKANVNAFTILLAHELEGTKIKVNAMCPGWVQTDMGGKAAPRTVAQGADTAVWLATANNIPSGKFFRDRQEIKW